MRGYGRRSLDFRSWILDSAQSRRMQLGSVRHWELSHCRPISLAGLQDMPQIRGQRRRPVRLMGGSIPMLVTVNQRYRFEPYFVQGITDEDYPSIITSAQYILFQGKQHCMCSMFIEISQRYSGL